VVMVTGAARGLGLAVAEAFAREGARVVMNDILGEPLREAAADIRSAGGQALAVPGDITDPDSVAAMVDEAHRAYGAVQVLINSAGSLSAIGPIWEAPMDKWRRDLTVNAWGTYSVTRACVNDMIAGKGGYVISLVGAGVDPPHLYRSAYDGSKAAVVKLTETLAVEGARHGIITFTLFPGAVLTAMTRNMLDSPEGHRWIPSFAEIFEAGRDHPVDETPRMALRLVSGVADALTGRYIRAWADLDALVARADEIIAQDLYTLRLRE